MYQDPALQGFGTHDEWRKRAIEVGALAPLIVGDINLDERSTNTGIGLGYAVRPGKVWQRLSWHEYIQRTGALGASCEFPPCFRWFPRGSWPFSIEPPPEGSLDEESFAALIDVLSRVSSGGSETECLAYYAPLATRDYDHPHVWRGPLRSVPSLVDEFGGPYGSSPSNFWPADRAWFVWTDWDLEGTKVSGSRDVVSAVRTNDVLETSDWTRPSA
jgi:hypothetical protein